MVTVLGVERRQERDPRFVAAEDALANVSKDHAFIDGTESRAHQS